MTCIEIAPGGEADPFHRGIAEIRHSFVRIIPGSKDAQTSIKRSRGGSYWLNGEKMLLVFAHCEGGFTGGSTPSSAWLFTSCANRRLTRSCAMCHANVALGDLGWQSGWRYSRWPAHHRGLAVSPGPKSGLLSGGSPALRFRHDAKVTSTGRG